MSDITDWSEAGIWPLQHHDPTFSVKGRRRLSGVRLHPAQGDNFTPSGQTYGDIQGGLFWPEVAGAREFLNSWFFTGAGTVSVSGGAGPDDPTQTKTRDSGGGAWLFPCLPGRRWRP